MSIPTPRRQLPAAANLEHLRKQAKRLVKETPSIDLATAQHQLAQSYGFTHWADMAAAVEETQAAAEVRRQFTEVQRRTLAGKDDPAELLGELIRLLDGEVKARPRSKRLSLSYLLGTLQALGKRHPPALDYLRARQRTLREDLSTDDAWSEYALLCGLFKEPATLVEAYDQARDSGRPIPAPRWIFPALLEVRRYAEAAAARPFEEFDRGFGVHETLRFPESVPAPLRVRPMAAYAGESLEAFAGAGDLAAARRVIERMLARDRSADTLTLLRKHAERCGHPGLVDQPHG